MTTKAVKTGLYEQVITNQLAEMLSKLDPQLTVSSSHIDQGESHSVLAQHFSHRLAQLLSEISGNNKLEKQIDVCNKLLSLAEETISEGPGTQSLIADNGKRLLQVHNPLFPQYSKPATPLSTGSLLTATSGDPSLVSQLKQEMLYADQVDILVSFIKWSGVRILKDELEELTRRGRLRVITTSYLGATDSKAIEYLLTLPNTEIRVSFDTKRTRLHAKAYIFHRETGFGAAYVGSSNISNPAMTDGLEWNVKICQYEAAHLWEKINATFETYQSSREFDLIDSVDLPRLDRALEKEKGKHDAAPDDHLAFFDITPYPYQLEILDKLEAERSLHHRNNNLLVAATGTGKTVVAAFDYKRFRMKHGSARLLFVAHRQEILTQSRSVFRNILRDQNFGELWVGNHTPNGLEHLFVSVQTFHSQSLWKEIPANFYDFIIIDEFHHAAAISYHKLTEHFTPEVLLGLTATPERADCQDILSYFDHHIAAEIRLPDAINRKLLSPFQYFCITDQVDYSKITWKRGGYDTKELEAVLVTGDDIRAKMVIEKMHEIMLDVSQARGLCFCVSQAHAQFMARQFMKHGIRAMALTSETPAPERRQAISSLTRREVNFLCTVDLFNEGVDIPEIDTVLLLRPTESLTVYLQQLGRGLRLHEEKEYLTVLDFIGQAHEKFNFEIRFRALLGQTTNRVEDEISHAFPSLPSGCVIEMEKQAKEYVLDNISKALTHANRNQIVQRIATFNRDTGLAPTLGNFLNFYDLDFDTIYGKSGQNSWSRLCVHAGVKKDFTDEDEKSLSKGLRRFSHNNSAPQLRTLLSLLRGDLQHPSLQSLSREKRRLLTMFCFSLWNNRPPEDNLQANIERIKANTTIWHEVQQLITILIERSDTVVYTADTIPECPLSIHARYTRDEILSGLGYLTFTKRVSVREGVKFLLDLNTDVFFITLNKTEHDYSPTTMYKDYALDDTYFHWQSQSTTSERSPTGRRYINHQQNGSKVLLFVREHKSRNNLASPYYFLGPATYVRHTGSRPMSIIWKLQIPMPGKLIRTTTRLAAA